MRSCYRMSTAWCTALVSVLLFLKLEADCNWEARIEVVSGRVNLCKLMQASVSQPSVLLLLVAEGSGAADRRVDEAGFCTNIKPPVVPVACGQLQNLLPCWCSSWLPVFFSTKDRSAAKPILVFAIELLCVAGWSLLAPCHDKPAFTADEMGWELCRLGLLVCQDGSPFRAPLPDRRHLDWSSQVFQRSFRHRICYCCTTDHCPHHLLAGTCGIDAIAAQSSAPFAAQRALIPAGDRVHVCVCTSKCGRDCSAYL